MGVPIDDDSDDSGKSKATKAVNAVTGAVSDQLNKNADVALNRYLSAPQKTVEPQGVDVPKAKLPTLGSYKKGGKIPKTGRYELHRNEVVVPADKARSRTKTDRFVRNALKTGRSTGRR